MFATKETGKKEMSSRAIANTFRAKAISNMAFRGIQTKLTIGQPNDKYEQEADRVADRIMSMPEPAKIQRACSSCQEEDVQTKPLFPTITPLVQRQLEDEEEIAQTKPLIQQQPEEEEEEQVQTKRHIQRQSEEEEEEPVMTKSNTGNSQTATSTIETGINQSTGHGSPLPTSTLTFMENRFGTDFSGVRVHNNSNALQLNRQLNAQAFTKGSNIYFSSGRYNPETSAGKHLLAHELTHVVQQGYAKSQTPVIQRLVRRTRVSGCGVNNPYGAERRAVRLLHRAITRVQNAIASRVATPANADVLAVRRAVWRAFRFGNNNRTWNTRLPIIRRRMEMVRDYLNSVVFQFECCPVGGPCPLSTCGNCQAGEEAATCAGNSTYIALCPLFWAASRNRNQRGRILAHEVFHINFGFVQDWAQPDFHNAHCYAQFIALLSGFNSPAGFRCH
ncbi:DUF4157 domain-containing protein [Draconibacterium sp.]|nr:DUF4157 domain-containing protein [Draconibacterium sp.]